MARVRSVDFLPEIFQTPVNRQFLAATLDQLIQEPKFQKTQGFVGRRVGPGVNPEDRYVIEPTKTRNDYQLEPGVVGLEPGTNNINDVITYPGINDALRLQGAYTNNSDRLYTSEYYAWDPFVDFDKFVNYQQYYWLPSGPLDVDVSSSTVLSTDNFVVTRANGTYTFSGVAGTNPALTLVRGGSYTFQVAQNDKQNINFRVQNRGISAYLINYEPNPTLTLVRGNTYTFTLSLTGLFPFFIKTLPSLGNINTYDSGVTNNGASIGTVTFVVPQDAPDVLYYSSATQLNMRGTMNIIDATSGTGPGFWIQAAPGVNGTLPATPNISSRDVLGVTNNGEDLGTITFDVPLTTAQSFYYNLIELPGVDLITTLQYDQINGKTVEQFFIENSSGIDGIVDLNNRTLVFQYNDSGWGTVPESLRYNVWRINYVDIAGTDYIQLTNVLTVNNLEKFSILYGTQYASTGWYKNTQGLFEQIPLLTAVNNVLYYQDGLDPALFGEIRLIDPLDSSTLRIDDIIDRPNYTSPNGVVFTNGLKVIFRGNVDPASYQNQSYYVEGVGTAIRLLPVADFVTPETYTQSASIAFDQLPYDVGNFDGTLNAPARPDYLTINRASPDLNGWSRSNRWFHIDVINYSAELNNIQPTVDNAARGRRPILEFRAGTRLFNFGTQGKQPVNIIDFQNTDALSNINGTLGYGVDGYSFINGTRVIFAADRNPNVRNKVYQVEFIMPDTQDPLILQPIINLVPASDADVLINQTVVCLSGITLQGKSFYYDGVTWLSGQDKESLNQAPLFDVFDSSEISLGNLVKYPSSTFTGSKLLSYAPGTGPDDPVLEFALKYLNLANIGDIVFDNNLYTDTFIYVKDSVSATEDISFGFVHRYLNRVAFVRELGWQTAVTPSITRQQFRFTYEGRPLQLDVKVSDSVTVPAIQLYVNARFQDPSRYSVATTANTTTVTLTTEATGVVPGDIIEIAAISDQVSAQGFYQVPINLENNPINANSGTFTLGTVRSHYGTIGENLIALQGPINGANNTRDLGNIVPYGLQILQQSSPLTLAGYFARNLEYDIFASIEYNSREYIKFKNLMLETVVRNEYGNATVAQILDLAIADITQGRTDINPFYWSDMLPTGSVFLETTYTITPITTNVFDTELTYDFTSANFQGLLVYLTRTGPEQGQSITTLLSRHTDYVVSTDGPTLAVTVPLVVGDVVTLREYQNTAGNFCPNTPSKMGLYPKYLPRIFVDTNYINPTPVIQGHDGSITVAFGDIRDEILIEFETRIYNNLKTDDNPVPLTIDDVIPGFFRTTDYTQTEITAILGESFLSWIGWNKLDYKTQDYVANNPFTYNYSSAGSRITSSGTVSNTVESPLLGAWRGIYRFFYDTISPNLTPWEMLGFSEEPAWWTQRYGPAPYTSDNLVLWDDLEAGLVADPVAPYVIIKFRRPGLTSVIPVGTEGQLLAPINSVVGAYDPTAFRKSWVVGDGGPVESSWWTSSSYPFAVMRLLALTRPAEFFSLFADRDRYRFSAEFDQYLYDGRYRLSLRPIPGQDNISGIEVYGRLAGQQNGISKASYINWIVDYNQQLGRNSTERLTDDLANIDVRLCYRMASFTNKQYLKIFTEKSSPNSQNSSLLLPDRSYNLLLYKNQPFADIVYSALIVERVATGYAVFGYSTTNPYFEIFASSSGGVLQTITGGGAEVRVPVNYTDIVVQVPYGYVFTNTTMVVDFILSYGAYLESQGLIFADVENGYQLNWKQMATEFLYFSQQGWATGTLINLNPVANRLIAVKAGAVVDTIESLTPENMLLDQNRGVLPTRDLVIDRNENTFTVTSNSNQTISYLHLRFTNYEHMVVLDNVSIFADLIYDPITAARQNRVRITAATTTEWNGQVDAQGFILNENNVKEWQSNLKYTKGEIVLYKNNYWSAQTIVQPKLLFDYNDWVTADYTLISEGLLPNIANKADQLANSYNTYGANLERDNDLLSYGLIGFRPRQYMAALNLDDVSQVNIYQQFLGSKGTIRSAELFTRADLGKESGEYNIYENWAILASTYGANANRSFFELRLTENLLQSNPSVIQVINPQQSSDADQTVLLSNVWRESFKLTSTDILPTTYSTISDTALPSAGYVNLNDADITVFSLDDPSSIAANLDSVGIGTVIWVAKTNPYDWNIYRCERVTGRLTQVADNLNQTSVATFTSAHGLVVGDLIIVRYFSQAVDGVYRVLSVPGITQVVIAYNFISTNQTTLTGDGLVFYLQTARVAQPSDIATLPYANSLVPGARVWVDDNGAGHWVVLEKQNSFTDFDRLRVEFPMTNNQFGFSIAQGADNFTALVGAPGLDAEDSSLDSAGGIYTYRRTVDGNYGFNINLQLNAVDTLGFGNSVDFGNRTWGVAGASGSNNYAGYAVVLYLVPGTNDFILSQMLLAPDLDFSAIKFGSAVTISPDERWMYVSAADGNKVYAYGKVEIENQRVVYVTDGATNIFNYSNFIEIDSVFPNQLVLSLDNLQSGINVDLVFAIDYFITATTVVLFSTPTAGLNLSISRRQIAQLDDYNYFGILQNTTSGLGSDAVFSLNSVRGAYVPTLISPGSGYAPGDTLVIFGATIGGATPANNLTITVTTVDANTGIATFTNSGTGISNITTFALNPDLYTATNIYSFTVAVDGQLQRPFIDYTFNTGTTEVTFINNPSFGSIISVSTGSYWQYVDTLTVPGLSATARFGSSVTTTTDGRQILIGSPLDDAGAVNQAGSVYAFDRSVIRYLVTDVAQLTYAMPGTPQAPISVILNNQFLNNSDDFINGQFSVVGSDIVLSSTTSLTIGDVIEIETNEFQQIQKIVSATAQDESAFGTAVEICSTNCSVYTGEPLATVTLPQEGQAQRNVNQSRVYGVTSTTKANPTLTAGDTIRINNTEVAVPFAPDNTIQGLISAINSAQIPNVTASATADLILSGDSVTKIFDIGTIYSATTTYTTVVYLGTVLQTAGVDYTYNNNTKQLIFVAAPTFGTTITVVSGRMTVSVINIQATLPNNKLTVLPGVGSDDSTLGSAFDDLGFDTYYYVQTIVSPNPTDYAYFGQSLDVDSTAVNLIVGAPNGDVYAPVTFDLDLTYFDDRSTTFFSPVFNSGVAYTFDLLPSATSSINNPGALIFGQQVYDTTSATNDRFGFAVNYRNGRLLIGSPGNDQQVAEANYGQVTVCNNPDNTPAWAVQILQQPSVNVDQINSVFMYDRLTSNAQQYFDFFNPLQGKILGAARRNIDYIGAVDPADYNTGLVHNLGNSWAQEHVGEIWWDTDTVRFIDPNQDNITYASRRWGQVFPGSRVDIYQWVSSSVPPVSYTGPGIALSTTSYTVTSSLNQLNIFETRYYFWVRGITTIDVVAGKTLSTVGIANYIENPRGSGIPYIAPLSSSTIAIYNALDIISAADTILHIEYDRQLTSANVHQEYELIADGRADSFLNDTLYRKLLDSFCGVNASGANVPDPLLSPAEQYGVQFRPRQSMFVDRFVALQNYLQRANNIFLKFPMVEIRRFNLLNSSEPEPSSASGAWNQRVANLEELSFQNIRAVPLGYKYLVVSDSGQSGLWTIYEVEDGLPGQRVTKLVRVQNYDTRRYWNTIDWYEPGYNRTIQPVAEVQNYSDLDTLTLSQAPVGSSVKVTANAQGKFEIYVRIDLGWNRVGLQNGTIEIKEEIWNYAAGNFGFDVEVFDAQYFDQEPVIETRQIIRAINEELFIDELLIERNLSLMLVFNVVYSESEIPEWLIKTSLIDVDHKIRALLPFQNYLRDNQDFVLDYIQEVKPYHVQIREFNLTYDGDDAYPGNLTDYDLPAYYDRLLTIPQFVSPVLLPYTQSGSFIQSNTSDVASNAEIWTLAPWKDWYNNYLLSVQSVTIISGGAGYTSVPEITVTGICTEPAELSAIINSAGRVIGIDIVNPGSGYSSTPTITITGNGIGARAVPNMGNDLIRTFKTVIKYDRYQYSTTVFEWQPDVTYPDGTQVRYIDRVWSAVGTVNNSIFDLEQWTPVPADTLSGVDRTMGFYTPTVNQPGLSLPLLIDGVDYPGVQVQGINFDQNTGFDVGNFDINPFDNLSISPEGFPTYDPGILDAIYGSSYLDLYLGTRPTDVNVDGGGYVDTYSSHAPEELIPGAEFDTLDFRVYTRAGSDWLFNGHGFPNQSVKFIFDPLNPTQSWADLVPYPQSVIVTNLTNGQDLTPDFAYVLDWVEQTITIIQNVDPGDIIVVSVYGLGGGNQLFENSYQGSTFDTELSVPVAYDQILEFAIFVNGHLITNYTYSSEYATTGVSSPYNPTGSSGTTLVVVSTLGIQVGSLIVGTGFTSGQTVMAKTSGLELIISAPPDSQPSGVLTFLANINSTKITFANSFSATDMVTLTAIGPTTVDNIEIIDYSWSAPQTQIMPGDGSTLTYELDNSLAYTNPDNLIVTVNGLRARTSAGIEYYGDGSSEYLIPDRLGYSYALIADNEVNVYIDDIPLILNVDYVVEPYNPFNGYDGRRVVVFAEDPPIGARILICVDTNTQCYVNRGDSTLNFQLGQGLEPGVGDVIEVTTWNDTRQQNILTQVFVGPVQVGITITEPYDSTRFDQGDGTSPGEPDYPLAPFDFSADSLVVSNNLDLGRIVVNADRLWVTVNGRRLYYGFGFGIVGQELILTNGILGPNDVVMITQFTESIVPEPMAFRIFQDMRGVQATYRMTVATTTQLAQPLGQYDDVIYLVDASTQGEPNLAANIWGVLTVNGERIMYRERDTVNNTISSLLRGTAGTAAASHDVGSTVYSLGRGNLLPEQYQNYIVNNTFVSDGTTVEFVTDIVTTETDLDAVEIYVGGIRTTNDGTFTGFAPVSFEFDEAPPAGLDINILVRRGVTWYAPGPGTPSNGVALQDTNTQAARFLRGLT